MRQRFTEPEWNDLVRLPAVVYRAVAEADGKVDRDETSSFLAYVRRTSHADELLASIFDHLAEQGEEAAQTSSREHDYRSFLGLTKGVLQRHLSSDERRSFLAGLLCLGRSVADASGGFFGLGQRVSAAEQARIEEVCQLLGWFELS